MNFRIITFVAALSLVGGCGPKARIQRAERADPWSPQSLQRYLDEVMPIVEEVAGRRFKERPKVAVADEHVFKQLLMDEQLRIYAQVMPDTPESIRLQLAEAAGAYMTSGILGKYLLATETVYVCPTALIPAIRELGIDARRTDEVVKVVLAHEITHALEDQYTDLENILDGLHDEEALWAASGAWEGWATLVEQRVADRMGLQDIYGGLLHLQGWGEDGLIEPSAWRTWAIYGQGKAFVEWHDRIGGIEQVWATLADPPTSTSMLFRPDTWQPGASGMDIDYASVLRGLEQVMQPGDWLVTNSRLGEFDLRGEAVKGGHEEDLERILWHLRHARRLDMAQPDRSGSVRLMVFDDPSWARAYLDLLRAQQTYESIENALLLDLPVEVTYGIFDQIPADDAFLRVERMPFLGASASAEKQAAWIVRDEVLVVVEVSRFSPGDSLARTAELVFERLEAARLGGSPADP